MIFRSATAEDLMRIEGAPLSMTCRALVAEDEGRTLAVFGIYMQSTRWVMFSELTDEFRGNKRGVVKGIRALNALISSRPAMPLMAEADPEIKGSDVLLKHMGFEQFSGSIYQCPGIRQSLPFSL